MEGQIIKPTQNAFDLLSRVGDRSATFHFNLAFMTNYSRQLSRKRKIFKESIDSTTSLFIQIKHKRNN